MREVVSKERTRNYLQQIRGTVVYKVASMAASFVTIPLMIDYLGKEVFGVWSTLLSIMSWVIFFDLGVGNGLRNKVAESLAKNQKNDAINYIATGYALIGLIAFVTWVMVTAVSFFVPWQIVFNTQVISESTLRMTIQIATFLILLNFWIGLIAAVLSAVQKTSLVAFGQLITSLLVLASVFALTKTTEESISNLALVYGLSSVCANIILSLWFYKSHPELQPRLKLVKEHVRPLLSVGMRFFIIQLAALVIFSTDKILITQLFGPQHVTQYEVAYRLFTLILIAHGLIMAPIWSAYTEAYHKEDFTWIKQMLKIQLILFCAVLIFSVVLGMLSRNIVSLWIGANIKIDLGIVVAMTLFVIVSCWNNIFAFFVNGIGSINMQLITSMIAMVINIPISIFYVKQLELGVSGVILGTTTSLLLAAVALPVQVYRILKRK